VGRYAGISYGVAANAGVPNAGVSNAAGNAGVSNAASNAGISNAAGNAGISNPAAIQSNQMQPHMHQAMQSNQRQQAAALNQLQTLQRLAAFNQARMGTLY